MAGSKKTNHGKKSGGTVKDGDVTIDFNRSTDQSTETEREVFEKMWALFLEKQGSPANNEENFELFKDYIQRVSTQYSFPGPTGNISNIINQKELVPMWIKIYSGSKNYTLESENDITGEEIIAMIRAIGNSSDLEYAISTILFRIRCYTRSNTQYETTGGPRYPPIISRIEILQQVSPFTLFRTLEAKLHRLDLDTELKSQINFATIYEKAVLLNSKRAFSRSLSELSKIQDQSFRNIRICHPALTFPTEMAEILMIYTQSMIGAHYKSEGFQLKTEQLREWSNKLLKGRINDEFESNSLAIVQYYLQVSLERMDGQNYDFGYWLEFKKNHPDFYPDRVGSYLRQFKQKQVPWQSKMQESFRILTESLSVERDANLKDLTKNGLDLSVNNSTSVLRNEHLNFRKKTVSRDTKDIHYSSSYEINKWISYIDLIKLNLFRATKNLSQHLIRYGPYDLQSGALTWIKSEFSGVTSGESDPQYLFRQYMRQNFKTSRNLKTTKLDRTNLISMVLEEMSAFLSSYAPSARAIGPVMYRVGLNRRPILTAEGKDEIPLALHVNCAFQRVSDLCSGVTIVRNALEISSLIETHRIAIERILSSLEEFLGIELLHIQLISRSREVSESLLNSNEYISALHQKLMEHFNSSKSGTNETNQSRTLKRAEFNQLLFSLPGNPIQRGHRSMGRGGMGLDDQTHEFKPIFFKHPEQITELVSVDGDTSDPKELFKTLCPESLIHQFSIHSIDEGKIAELMKALATREAYHPRPIPIVHSRTGYMSTFIDYNKQNHI